MRTVSITLGYYCVEEWLFCLGWEWVLGKEGVNVASLKKHIILRI